MIYLYSLIVKTYVLLFSMVVVCLLKCHYTFVLFQNKCGQVGRLQGGLSAPERSGRMMKVGGVGCRWGSWERREKDTGVSTAVVPFNRECY